MIQRKVSPPLRPSAAPMLPAEADAVVTHHDAGESPEVSATPFEAAEATYQFHQEVLHEILQIEFMIGKTAVKAHRLAPRLPLQYGKFEIVKVMHGITLRDVSDLPKIARPAPSCLS